MLKYSQLYKFPNIEACLVLLMAYSSYFFSNGTQMSGIVTLLFTGITLKHYAYDNLSTRSKRATKFMFQILSQLSENFIFIYLGINLFTQDNLDYKPLFILVTLAFICIARYASVAPLSMMINAVCRALGKPEQLPRNHQMMLFWAGLRGAVAFALASGITGDSAPAMRTTILAVVVLTVLLFGGTTSRMLQVLDVKTGVIEPDESGGSEIEDDYEQPSPRHQQNIRGRSTSTRTSRNNKYTSVNTNDYEEEEDDYESEEDLLGGINSRSNGSSNNRRRNSNNNNDQSIGGLLSGPLGEPIPEDRPPHWFVSFDEKWLKPFLTKKHVQARNLTLAEYWREKKIKMERANRNMLDGIRGINTSGGSSQLHDVVVDQDDNSDALTLHSVKGVNSSFSNRNRSQTSFPRPNLDGGSGSQKMVFGSGRVFGRSPSIDSDEER